MICNLSRSSNSTNQAQSLFKLDVRWNKILAVSADFLPFPDNCQLILNAQPPIPGWVRFQDLIVCVCLSVLSCPNVAERSEPARDCPKALYWPNRAGRSVHLWFKFHKTKSCINLSLMVFYEMNAIYVCSFVIFAYIVSTFHFWLPVD